MALAYDPRRWSKVVLSLDEATALLGGSDGFCVSSYVQHVSIVLWMTLQLVIATVAGFTHAFFAWCVPFAAEEIIQELATIVELKRSGGVSALKEARPYAFQPWRWVLFIDGLAHVKFSGGSYYNHGKFAAWASGQFTIGVVAGIAHAFIPCLVPGLMEDICAELGNLVKKRRMLRNKQKDNTFVNPENLSDYFNKSYTEKFAKAEEASKDEIGSGDGVLERRQIPTQLQGGEKPKFLGK